MKKSKEDVKFSFVMPTYNREHYLANTIDSILKQTYKNWELIVVDDGSTDHTERLMSAYKNNKKIRYYKRPHKGISASRNYGNSKATGDWIAIQDSDDLNAKQRLAETYKYIKKHDVDAVYSTLQAMTDQGIILDKFWQAEEFDFAKIQRGNQCIMHPSTAHKKNINIKYRENKRANVDFWFAVDCAKAKVRFGYIEKPLVLRRISADSVSTKYQKMTYKELSEYEQKELSNN